MLSLYRRLLRLYPRAHRLEFGDEMLAVFLEARAESRDEGAFRRGVFCAREIAGLLRGAVMEHVRSLFGFPGPSLFHSRRSIMRTESRFPVAAATLMTATLALVAFAIRVGNSVAVSLRGVNSPFRLIPPAPSLFSLASIEMVLFPCLAGAAGWAILFALRRSGIQRLTTLDTSVDRAPR